MRELTAMEIEQVSGGASTGEYATEGGALGSIIGGALTNTLKGAARGGLGGALVMATFGLSFNATTYLLDRYS